MGGEGAANEELCEGKARPRGSLQTPFRLLQRSLGPESLTVLFTASTDWKLLKREVQRAGCQSGSLLKP